MRGQVRRGKCWQDDELEFPQWKTLILFIFYDENQQLTCSVKRNTGFLNLGNFGLPKLNAELVFQGTI